jgi:thiol:disulfide interchange protein DsbD
MNKGLLTALSVLVFTSVFSQIHEPVKWKTRTEKITGTEFNLVFEAKIDDGWHVYTQSNPEDASLPMIVKFKDIKGNYELIGKTKESPSKKVYSEAFEKDEFLWEDSFTLTQRVKVTNFKLAKIVANVDYQICKDGCIGDNKDFTFAIPKIAMPANVVVTSVDTLKPQVKTADSAAVNNVTVKAAAAQLEKVAENEDRGMWSIFIGCILAGLLATITPCVFPMIPMTVSFFIKQSNTKARGKFNAFFYGFCIIAICVLVSVPFHLIEGLNPDILSDISTNVQLNLFFFIVFVVFAISFFGAFEITLPSRFANKVDDASNKGGLMGIFFMALTLIIVSFSCIGPALGFVLGTVLNSDGGAMILTMAMLGFGIGLALPFMFFAFAPSVLGNLPKSGGWLNTVKVVFGFIELALAFKFLSNADLVLQLHLLEREVFLAIWIAIFGTMSLYLFGKIRTPHDSPLEFISVGRLLLGLLTLAFTIYLIPGLWGAPLKLISAFPPPGNYSESPQGFGASSGPAANALPEGAVYGPHHIVSFEEYDKGLAYAKKVNKPVLIDFTGRACQNCRLMENNVWSSEKVLKILQNDVVLISLYGDERIDLPESEQFTSKQTGNRITTIGQKWSEFQRLRYGSNARPYYVLMAHDETSLNKPVAYTPNIEEYYNWLMDGISKFKRN